MNDENCKYYFEDFKFYAKLEKIYSTTPNEIKKARKNLFFNVDKDFTNSGNNLYVYYDVNTIDRIANETNELWLKSAKAFSDKEERISWKYKYRDILCGLKEKEYSDKFKKIVNEVFETYDIEKYLKRYYICCLSYEPDNNLCWNTFKGNKHYNLSKIIISGDYALQEKLKNKIVLTGTDLSCELYEGYSHGACICFNKDVLDITFEKHSAIHGFVNYSSKELIENFFNCLDTIYEIYNINNDKNEAVKRICKMIDLCNIFYKNRFYSGEKEYRYAYDLSRKDDKLHLIKFKDIDVYKLKFRKEMIEHITITNSSDKVLFNKDFDVLLSKLSYNEEDIDAFDSGMIYES